MRNVIKGIFENGQITLNERPPVEKRTAVLVTFIPEKTLAPAKKRQAGVLSGKIKMSDDFDDPIDAFNAYS
ncbi:DUF2281 domain-containing protein [Dyadobacter sp. Leaf189]|jgi:hypothetical protein|uniref:DUF2281 domain-containing protein n=1 Tax=Dyadobacter sp. Leaf189 TaxID=1736295 RepID=UPI0006F5FDBD|nr:DUF2281 domain-containing protein [Dyadobacter sp. Leaf189]KQS33501.1 hypothetical protein ASG33_05360 [Dyadobacter sp. Leaf189]